MNNRSILNLCAMTALGLTLMPGNTFAQTGKDIVGTWKPISVTVTGPDGRKSEPFGPNPNSILTFDANGRFVLVNTRPDLPKFASNNRMQGTAEENKANVQGTIAYFGTYTVNEPNHTVALHIDSSSYPNIGDTDQKRTVTLAGDTLKLENPAPSRRSGPTGQVWERLK